MVPLYGRTPTAAEKTGNLFPSADIPVQTKLFVSADTQRKVCVSVEKYGFVSREEQQRGSTEGKGAEMKKHVSIKQTFAL